MHWQLPPLWFILLSVIWLLIPFLSAWQIHKFIRLLRKQGERLKEHEFKYTPFSVVILPIKGVDENFKANIDGLMSQNYPAYRLIFAVESEEDPAFAALNERINAFTPQSNGLQSIELCVAGLAERGGQKVHNQRHALSKLTKEDAAIAFADADAVPDSNWLRTLVFPLHNKEVGVSTGYRWLIPEDGHPASQFASVINASIATMSDQRRRNIAWGGSMACRHETLDRINLESAWDGALSDDLQITIATRRAGLSIYFLAILMIPSPVSFTWGSLFSFARRQYIITRTHRARAWWFPFIALGTYLSGWVMAITMLSLGYGLALVPMAGIYLLDNWRAATRARAVKLMFDEVTLKKLKPTRRIEHLLTPLYIFIHWCMVISAMFGRHITWAGTRYHIKSPTNVVIKKRETQK